MLRKGQIVEWTGAHGIERGVYTHTSQIPRSGFVAAWIRPLDGGKERAVAVKKVRPIQESLFAEAPVEQEKPKAAGEGGGPETGESRSTGLQTPNSTDRAQRARDAETPAGAGSHRQSGGRRDERSEEMARLFMDARPLGGQVYRKDNPPTFCQ